MNPWHCPRCGWSGTSPPEATAGYFHHCRPPRRSIISQRGDYLEGTTIEEVWRDAFATALGGYYQPPTPQQARAETGETGRRKEGSGRRTPKPDPNTGEDRA